MFERQILRHFCFSANLVAELESMFEKSEQAPDAQAKALINRIEALKETKTENVNNDNLNLNLLALQLSVPKTDERHVVCLTYTERIGNVFSKFMFFTLFYCIYSFKLLTFRFKLFVGFCSGTV